MKICSFCGKDLGSLARFCIECGTELPKLSPEENPGEDVDHKQRLLRDKLFVALLGEPLCSETGHGFQREKMQAVYCIECGQKIGTRTLSS